MSESVTSEDFQALIAELKKTNKQLGQQEKGGLVGGIKKKIEDVKDSVTSPFKRIKETIAAPGKFIGNAVEDIGDAVMSPFESFKNVSEGFKNIFSKNETEQQTALLEQILQGIEDLNQNVSVNTNREQNQDLIKLEQGKEQRTIFRSISDNIKNAGVGAGGRGARRKGKGGVGGGGGGQGGLTQNLISDFFLASIVSQRGIGEFINDFKSNLVLVRKFLIDKPFKKVFGGVVKIGKGAINLAKDVFGKEKGQKGLPFRRAAVKDRVSSVVSSAKDKAKGLKERFFPKIPKQIEVQPAQGEFDTSTALRTGEPKSLQLETVSESFKQERRTRSDAGIERGSSLEAGGERILNNINQQELFSEDIVKSNYAIVEAVKENTKSLVKVLAGNDLKKAETEKERDKTFQDIADSLEDIEGSGLGKGTENKKGEGLISEIIDEYGGKLAAAGATFFGGKRFLASQLGQKAKGLFSRLNPFSGSKAATGAPSPRVPQPTLTGPAQTIRNAGQAGADASSRTIKNITNAPGSSVVGAPKPKPKGLSRFIPKRLRAAGALVAGGASFVKDKVSSLNPMQKIKDATKGLATKFPSMLKRIPVIGGVIEGIFLNSEIKRILADPEVSEAEKKDAVGTEFIKALTGPAGAAIAIGAVGALTGGVGFLASAVTGTAGYAIGNVVGGLLASILPTKTIGGAIINTFYKDEAKAGGMNMDSAQGPITPEIKPQTTTENPVKKITQEAKEKRFAASRVAAKEAQAALTKFESENQEAEMVEVFNDFDIDDEPSLEYKDPEKQAQFVKLRSKMFDAEYDRTENARNVMGLTDENRDLYKSIDDMKTIDFIQDRFGIQFPGYSETTDGNTTKQEYVGSGAAIQFAQDLFAKNPNATGAEMLQAIQGGADMAAEMRASMQNTQKELESNNIINAPSNSNITTINEAPNHIDRTVNMFGTQPAY